jgi:hypothetical protein
MHEKRAGGKEYFICPQERRVGRKETRYVHRKVGLAGRMLGMSAGKKGWRKADYGCSQEREAGQVSRVGRKNVRCVCTKVVLAGRMLGMSAGKKSGRKADYKCTQERGWAGGRLGISAVKTK